MLRREALCHIPSVVGRNLEELFLGLMPYLDPKGEGDSSMVGNQRSCPGVWSEALGDPRDMVIKLDCLMPSLQKMQLNVRRKDA